MIHLELFNDRVQTESGNLISTIHFELYCKINILTGDSGDGKTLFFNNLLLADKHSNGWSHKCNKKINVCNTLSTLENTLKVDEDTLIIADEDLTDLIIENNYIYTKLTKSNNYFLLIDRGLVAKVDVNINAVFKLIQLETINKITLFDVINAFGLQNTTIESGLNKADIRYLISEDTNSGRIFWKRVFKNIELLELVNPGNSGVVDTLKINNKLKDYIILALDYDCGALALQQIIELRNTVDLTKVKLIPLESFEEVICNSEFILSKFPKMRDEVINYKEHITCAHKHTGKYFSHLLHKYVKVKSPIITDSKHNVTKFYSKGMKNFEQCFINDCCEFNSEDCKLYFEGDKKKAMLSNKFEFLQGLL